VRTRAIVCAFALGLLANPATAKAGPKTKKIVRGVVVQKIENEIYLSLGARDDKVTAASPVRFKRVISLRHPVSKTMVSDWLPIGRGTVLQALAELSVVHVPFALSKKISVGDVAEVLIFVDAAIAPPTQPLPTPTPTPTPVEPQAKEPLPTLSPETLVVLQLWRDISGKSLDERIRALNLFLRAHPTSPFVGAVREDLLILHDYQKSLLGDARSGERDLAVTLDHETPTLTQADTAVPLIFLPDVAGDVAKAWLHYRARGAATYKRKPLRLANGRYLRGEIPSESVKGEAVEFFVDVGTYSGTHGDAIGSARAPKSIKIASSDYASPLPGGAGRSRLSFTTSYLDFATFDKRDGKRTDTLMIVEGDVLYRLRSTLHAIRTGFGVVQGRGGYEDRVYDDEVPGNTYQYGFAELEFRSSTSTALIARAVIGSGADGFAPGGKARLRIGPEEESNLSAGFSVLPGLGFLTDIRMQWKAIDVLPIGLSVGLTDQPAQGDLGLRLMTDIGWQTLSWFQPTLRVSYQGRSVDHSGVGLGLGAVFDW
jgi:hypothetical protein